MTAEVNTATETALDRDPRQAPWGIFTGGSFAMDSVRVFMWFTTPSELASFLVEHLPAGYNFDEQDWAEYKAAVAPLAARVAAEGLTPALLAELNEAIKASMVIDWWGHFDELLANESEFARQIAGGFLDEDDETRALSPDEVDDFVEHLKTCGC